MPGKHRVVVNPLQRNGACDDCRSRKVRCSGDSPACQACVKAAVSRGEDPSQVTCSYSLRGPNWQNKPASQTNLYHTDSASYPPSTVPNYDPRSYSTPSPPLGYSHPSYNSMSAVPVYMENGGNSGTTSASSSYSGAPQWSVAQPQHPMYSSSSQYPPQSPAYPGSAWVASGRGSPGSHRGSTYGGSGSGPSSQEGLQPFGSETENWPAYANKDYDGGRSRQKWA